MSAKEIKVRVTMHAQTLHPHLRYITVLLHIIQTNHHIWFVVQRTCL
jgi:hypothetical protein